MRRGGQPDTADGGGGGGGRGRGDGGDVSEADLAQASGDRRDGALLHSLLVIALDGAKRGFWHHG